MVNGILVPSGVKFGLTFKQTSTEAPSLMLVPGVTVRLKYGPIVVGGSVVVEVVDVVDVVDVVVGGVVGGCVVGGCVVGDG